MEISRYAASPSLLKASTTAAIHNQSAFRVSDCVAESVEDWGHQGKKLGSLALVAAGTSIVPLSVMYGAILSGNAVASAPAGVGQEVLDQA